MTTATLPARDARMAAVPAPYTSSTPTPDDVPTTADHPSWLSPDVGVVGDWYHQALDASTIIFPYSRKAGKKVRVVVERVFLCLLNSRSGTVVVLKRYVHQGVTLWSNSVDDCVAVRTKPRDRASVVDYVGRCVFGGASPDVRAAASEWLATQGI